VRRTACFFLILTMALSAGAQEFAPGTRYDSRIPTLEAVLGHARLVEYARTWEGRPLHLLAIASPERIARLDEVKAGLQKLADPRRLAAGEGDRLVAGLPGPCRRARSGAGVSRAEIGSDPISPERRPRNRV